MLADGLVTLVVEAFVLSLLVDFVFNGRDLNISLLLANPDG